MEYMKTKLNKEKENQLRKLMESGVIAYSEGEWYIASRIDPYRQKPVDENAVIDYLNGVRY